MFLLGKLKLYAALIGAAALAIVAVYYRGKADGQDDLEYEIKDDRLNKILTAKEVQDELQNSSDDDIAARARRWHRMQSQFRVQAARPLKIHLLQPRNHFSNDELLLLNRKKAVVRSIFISVNNLFLKRIQSNFSKWCAHIKGQSWVNTNDSF